MGRNNEPEFSIVIPVHNRPESLNLCLASIYTQKPGKFETLVIDDGSTENLKEVAGKYPVRYFRIDEKKGPATARNFGAKHAKGGIIVFIDSDVLVEDGFLQRIRKAFEDDKEIAAVQGNYTPMPYHKGFFSEFKNMTLHYHFQGIPRYANSIASFCTAIRKDIFLGNGGFDQRVRNASIEDEEFGVKLTRKGHKIRYDNGLQVKHMKRFTFLSLVKQEYRTGFDKIKSLLRRKNLFDRRELRGSHSSFSLLASIPLSAFILLSTAWLIADPYTLSIAVFAALMVAFLLMNADYFRFMKRTKSGLFAVCAAMFSIIDYFSICTGIVFGLIHYGMGNKY